MPPMNLYEDTNPRLLRELLGQIHSQEAALPDFQRDFVWEPNATELLIVSIASNHPAGSLLRMRNTRMLFPCREFEGAPALNNHRPTYLVLDGQQRLTSLYQAFYGVGEHRYYLNLRQLLAGEDFEDCVFHLKPTARLAVRYESLDEQAADLVLPFSVLWGSGGFQRWMLQMARRVSSDMRESLENDLTRIDENWIRSIENYVFPVVTLAGETNAAAVCTIFETLNITGMKLTVFDLLTARFHTQDVNLRQLWTLAKEENPVIECFGVEPYYLLQAVSLASRTNHPSCKRGDVLNMEAGAIQEWWDRAVCGMAQALEMLRDDCGVMTPKWRPYNTIVIPLAAVGATLGVAGNPQAGANRQNLARWYWCSVFGQTYEKAPNSQAAKDTVELLRWLAGGDEPESVRSFRFDPGLLRDTTGRQRALYRGTIGLILRHGPRDFHLRSRLDGEQIAARGVDDHHVFPQRYLEDRGVSPRLRNCVVNHTLIDRLTNIRIGMRAPSDYMAEIRDAHGAANFDELLCSHLLPAGEQSPFWDDDFEGFLTWRQEALWREIQGVTSIH